MGGVMLEALRIRDFRLLWTGSLISSVGSWLLTIAIPAHVLMATGSLRDTGLTLAAQYLPMLILGPVAGVFADRWDRRRLMTAANVFCAGSVALMLSGTAPGRYWILYVALIAENGGAVLIAPALQARTPAVVGTGALLSSANSLNSVSSGAVRLIGGPLGGMLLAAYGIRTLIWADCASYSLAAVAMFLTPRPRALGVILDWGHRDQAGGPRLHQRGTRPARPARRAGAASRRGRLPGCQRIAQRPAHPLRYPAAGRRRAHRVPAVLPGRGLSPRGAGHPRAAGPRPAADPAGRHPGRDGWRLLPAVHLIVAGHRAACRGRRRRVRLDGPGDRADHTAAADSQRHARPGQRHLPDRRGGGNPRRGGSRAVPRPGGGPAVGGRRRQPPHARRGGAGAAESTAGTRDCACSDDVRCREGTGYG